MFNCSLGLWSLSNELFSEVQGKAVQGEVVMQGDKQLSGWQREAARNPVHLSAHESYVEQGLWVRDWADRNGSMGRGPTLMGHASSGLEDVVDVIYIFSPFHLHAYVWCAHMKTCVSVDVKGMIVVGSHFWVPFLFIKAGCLKPRACECV